MPRLAFIGLGRMGAGMAARLLAAGFDLAIYNRSPDKAAELATKGALLCTSPREAATGADAVISMVSDDTASSSVWLGEDGILAAAPAADCLAIECSTLSHGWVMALSGEAAAHGLRYIDAPVTGLPDGAANGTLTMLVGGESAHVAAAKPYFDPISEKVIHFGPIGAGTAYKLIINLIGAVQIASVAEGMALAERAGLDLSLFADALAGGQAASPQAARNARFIAEDSHDRTVLFTAPLRLKDVDYALSLAEELGIGAPFGAVAQSQFRALIDMGLAQSNESKVIEVARAMPVNERHE